MRPVSATIAIDAPRDRVFELLCDLSLRPAFTDHFLSDLRLGRVDPVGPGASARFRLGEAGIWMDTVIEVAEAPHLIRERGCTGRENRVPAHTVWELAPVPSPESTELTLTFWTEPATLADRLRERRRQWRSLRRHYRRALTRLKDLAEADRPVPRVAIGGADLPPAFAR